MKTRLLFLFLFFTVVGFSQFNSSAPWMSNNSENKTKELTIQEISQSFEDYWKDKDYTIKGSGYKPFKRWENHWMNNTNEAGYLITPQEIKDAFNQKRSASLNKTFLSLPASNWVPIGPINNSKPNSTRARGRVNIVHVDPSNPNTIYMGTPAGGIWKSTNSGTTWAPMSDELPQIGVSGIAVDYSNPNTIYISTGDKDAADTYSIGVMKSTDGGTTWNTTGLSFTNTSTRSGDILIHPTNNQILWCATSVGLQRSTNGGTTWTIVQTGNFSQGSIRLKPNDPSTVYAVSTNRFFKSTNTGSSFTTITTGLPFTSGRMVMDVSAANSDYIYILSSSTSNGFQGVFKSTNGGTNWSNVSGTSTNILENTQSWYDLTLAVSSTNAEEVYTGCLNIWKSTNGGASFTVINSWSSYTPSFTHADIHYLGFFNNKLYCGSDGGNYVSTNGGTTFTEITGEAQIGQIYKISVSKQSASKISAGFQDNGGFAYNGGLWRDYHGGDGMDTAISPANNNIIYGFLYYGQSLFISSNSGNSLSSSVAKPTTEPNGNWVTPMVANNAGELFAGWTKLFRLSGTTWVQQSTGNIGSGNIELLAVDPSNDDIMYFANGTGLYKSIDKGINVNLVYTAPTPITSIDVHSSDSNIVYLTTSEISGLALKSTNGGTSFTSFSQGLPNIAKNIIVHQGRNTTNPLYLGTSLGVYYRDDSMSQWEPFDTNLPNTDVTDLEINLEDNLIIASTYGRGVWQSIIPVEVPSNDVKFVELINPVNASLTCNGTLIPQVVVKNNGSNNINTVTVNYIINGTPYNFTWNGTLTPSQNVTINLPQLNLTKGTYSISVNSTIPNDAYGDNNSGAGIFYINDSGTVGQTNPFTNVSDELITYNEGSSGSQWVRGIRGIGPMSSGGNTVYTTNLTGNYPDAIKSYIVSQCYNLSNVTNPQIQFDMKYHLEENWDIVYVEYSTNFGQTWSLLGQQGTNWYNSNRTNASSGSANDCQNCPGGQWTGTNTTLTTYSYPLNALNNEQNVIFRIVFHTDEAENQLGVNVDDFVISGVLSKENFELKNISVYPNPSNGIFNISLGDIEPTSIEVYDLTGKIIVSKKEVLISNFETSIDLSKASQGIYFVKINTNNQNVVKRIIKK